MRPSSLSFQGNKEDFSPPSRRQNKAGERILRVTCQLLFKPSGNRVLLKYLLIEPEMSFNL